MSAENYESIRNVAGLFLIIGLVIFIISGFGLNAIKLYLKPIVFTFFIIGFISAMTGLVTVLLVDWKNAKDYLSRLPNEEKK